MEYKQLNRIFRDLENPNPKDLEFIEKKVVKDSTDSQGDMGEYYKIYRIKMLEENIFLKLTYITDSYGEDSGVTKIEFVQPKQVQVVDYVAITDTTTKQNEL